MLRQSHSINRVSIVQSKILAWDLGGTKHCKTMPERREIEDKCMIEVQIRASIPTFVAHDRKQDSEAVPSS